MFHHTKAVLTFLAHLPLDLVRKVHLPQTIYWEGKKDKFKNGTVLLNQIQTLLMNSGQCLVNRVIENFKFNPIDGTII